MRASELRALILIIAIGLLIVLMCHLQDANGCVIGRANAASLTLPPSHQLSTFLPTGDQQQSSDPPSAGTARPRQRRHKAQPRSIKEG